MDKEVLDRIESWYKSAQDDYKKMVVCDHVWVAGETDVWCEKCPCSTFHILSMEIAERAWEKQEGREFQYAPCCQMGR